MSNKTQLQINNASLDGYITRINAAKDIAANLPEAGESGGNGFENNTDTCDIQITSDYTINSIGWYGPNGHKLYDPYTTSYSISAICGSVIYIAQPGYYSATVSSGEILYEGWSSGFTYRVPSTPMSVSINITTD